MFIGDAYDFDDDELEEEGDGAMVSDVCYGGRDLGFCFYYVELVLVFLVD